jgi:hypothetical protein
VSDQQDIESGRLPIHQRRKDNFEMSEDRMPDNFDRLIGSLHGVPDVVSTQPSTVRALTPLTGRAETFIIQTFRHIEQGDRIFVERISEDGALRVVLPPAVANAIARQRDALRAKSRSKTAKRVADERKAAGVKLFGGLTPQELRRRRTNRLKGAAQ